MKINTHYILIQLLAVSLLVGSIVNIKLKAPLSDYSRTDTPDVLREMFKIVKKANPNESSMYDECLKVMLTSKNETGMKAFWESLKTISCKYREEVKKDYFVTFVNGNLDQIKVDNVDVECKAVITRNFIANSEIQGDSIQRRLRDAFAGYFDCPTTAGKMKGIITAFIGPHRGLAENTNLFKVLNGNQ